MSERIEAVWTVGHSTCSGAELVTLLQAHSIESLGDVRRFPASHRHPQFNRDALESSIAEVGMRYVRFEALGGRRSPLAPTPGVLTACHASPKCDLELGYSRWL